MSHFRYKAVTPAGDAVEGEIEASSRGTLIERLRNQGHIPIRVDEIKPRQRRNAFPRARLFPRRVSPKDLALVTRELQTLLHAGLPLERALSAMRAVSPEGPVKLLIGDVLERVRGGCALADAMAVHEAVFPRFYVGVVRAGEAGGALEAVLSRLSEVLERNQEVRETVRSALQYPMLVLLMAAAALVILLTVVVPEFRPLFEDAGAALPLSTRAIIALGDLVRDYWWLMASALAGAIAVIRWHNGTPSGRLRWDRWLLAMPLAGELIRKREVARFGRTLGMLLTNGVTLLPALSIVVETVSNRAAATDIAGTIERVKQGQGLAKPLLEANVFPPLALELIQVGEEGGQLEPMLLRVADIYEQELKRTIERVMALLVPAITIGLGLVVAAIIGSMLSAILSAYDLPLQGGGL